MREVFDQLLKTKIQKPVANVSIRKIKNLVLLLFAAGFFCFLIFGARFVDDLSLLDSTSLRRLRDTQIDKGAFFWYLCLSHMILLVLCGVLWWCQFGKTCMYTLLCLGAVTLGSTLALSLIRYRLKGITLWFVVYFPHTFLYFVAVVCGLAFSCNVGKSRTEKINFIFRNIFWLIGALATWLLGVYSECYISSAVLQTYLEHF